MRDDLEPITVVEIDYDFCSRTFGSAPCTASLGGVTLRKCHNTIKTCADTDNFDRSPLTLRFCTAANQIPKGATYWPVITDRGASTTSSTVNIAGQNPNMSAFGRRATVRVQMSDFPYHDRLTDKYQSERISGVAQIDEAGYSPAERGTFFPKLRARWPYFSGKPLRVINGYIKDGQIIDAVTRHYVIKSFDGPNDSGEVSFEAEDILALADKDRAQAPNISRGTLLADIAIDATTLTLDPEAIGEEYPAEGRAVIGTEIVSYTRSGDVVTLTGRGIAGSEAATHSDGDTFQEVLFFEGERLHVAVRDLLENYTSIDTSFIPFSDWEAEVERWLPQLRIDAHFTKPTAVSKIMAEFSQLGVSFWWDDVTQTIPLKANRPVDGDVIHAFTDSAITAINLEAQDDRRLTEIGFFSVQDDPTESETDEANYNVVLLTVDAEAKSENRYGDTKLRKVFCRLLNGGAESAIRIYSIRLLQRFNTAPVRITMVVDASRGGIALTDVVRLKTRVSGDATGLSQFALYQVIKRTDLERGNKVEIVCEAYNFEGRYGFITPNDYPVFGSASESQKELGAFLADETLLFPDGSESYLLI